MNPPTGFRRMTCVAYIRENDTGEVRRYLTDELIADGEEHPSVFNWAENNFSCDCNRGLFFGYTRPDVGCSRGRFSVNLERPDTGETYYKEF